MAEIYKVNFRNKTWRKEGPPKNEDILDSIKRTRERFLEAERKTTLSSATLNALRGDRGYRLEKLIELVYRELLKITSKKDTPPEEKERLLKQIKIDYPEDLVKNFLNSFRR